MNAFTRATDGDQAEESEKDRARRLIAGAYVDLALCLIEIEGAPESARAFGDARLATKIEAARAAMQDVVDYVGVKLEIDTRCAEAADAAKRARVIGGA